MEPHQAPLRRRRRWLPIAGLAVALGALAFIGLRAQTTSESMRAGTEWVAHTHQVLNDIDHLRAAIYQAESGRRGFELSKDADLLAQKDTGIRAMRSSVRALQASAGATQRIAQVGALIEAQIATMEEAKLRIEITKEQTKMLEAALDDLASEHRQLLSARRGAIDRDVGISEQMTLIGGTGSVAIILLAFGLLILELKKRAQIERALRNREARLARLQDANIIGMFTADLSGAIREANDAFLDLIGASREELEARTINWDVMTAPESKAADDRAMNELLARGIATPYEKEFVRRDGVRIPVLIGGALVDTEEERECVAFVVDLTARQRSKQLADEKIGELEVWTDKIHKLSEMSGLLQTFVSREEATQIVAHYSRRLFPETGGSLGLMRPSANAVETTGSWLGGAGTEDVIAPADCWAMRTGKPHRSGSVHDDHLLCAHCGGAAPHDLLCLPLAAGGESLGLLQLHRMRGQFTDAELRLALAFADTIALAEANLRLQERLRTQAIRDPLTGLFNRRYMEESLLREIGRAERRSTSVGVIMLDVDHFKRFNDEYGHAAGDAVMRELGTLLGARVRSEDIVCRYGGEEIAIILPDATSDSTAARAEQLRIAIKELRVLHGGRAVGSITASFGVAVYPEHGTAGPDLLRRADRALYAAKRAGRDNVAVFDTDGLTADLTRVVSSQRFSA